MSKGPNLSAKATAGKLEICIAGSELTYVTAILTAETAIELAAWIYATFGEQAP